MAGIRLTQAFLEILGSEATVSGESGDLVVTESGGDVAAFNATLPISGALAATEATKDVANINATRFVGALAATETSRDVAAFYELVMTSGDLAVTEEGEDIAAFSDHLAVAKKRRTGSIISFG